MFRKVLHNLERVLHSLLPPFLHNLRKRTHDRVLPDRLFRLADNNSIVCMLFYEAY